MSRKRLSVSDEPFLIVRSSASNPPAGAVIDDHAHEWRQLIYVSAGLIRVWTEAGSWVAPPTWAVWAPAGVRHGMRFVGASAFRTLYFRPDWWPDLPDECAAVTVSALLRALILRVTAQSALDRRVAVDTAIATVMLDEFRRSDAPPFTLPQPSSEPTRHAVALIAEGAPPSVTAGGLAQTVGLGVRTLERRFVAETGVTLGRWRRHRALLGALEQLAVGSPIKTVAASAGYSTSSAFVSAFRSLFGATPGRYFMLS